VYLIRQLSRSQLMREIKEDVRQMQARAYYGDGQYLDASLNILGLFTSDRAMLTMMKASGPTGRGSRIAPRWVPKACVRPIYTDSIHVPKDYAGPSDFPEYVCGVSASQVLSYGPLHFP
jgi:hypothetical protein